MTGNGSTFMTGMKKTFSTMVSGLRDFIGLAKEKVDLDRLFAAQAVKLKRISTNLVNLDPTVLGIFDRERATLTVRAGEKLEKGELVESEHRQYRVELVRPGAVQVPLELDHQIHQVSCRVVELKQL